MWMGNAAFPEGRCWTFESGAQISHHGPNVAMLHINKTVGGESKLVSFSPCKQKYDLIEVNLPAAVNAAGAPI